MSSDEKVKEVVLTKPNVHDKMSRCTRQEHLILVVFLIVVPTSHHMSRPPDVRNHDQYHSVVLFAIRTTRAVPRSSQNWISLTRVLHVTSK